MRNRMKPFRVTGESLGAIQIFHDVCAEEREHFARLCRGYTYRENEEIISHSEQTDSVYFIVSGQVKVALYSPSGREVVFRDLRSGEMFGELSALDGGSRSAHVITLTETTIASIGGEQFYRQLLANHTLLGAELRHLIGLVRSLSDRVFETDALKVNSRIHHYLVRRARQSLGELDAERPEPRRVAIRDLPKRADIAKELGTTRFAVGRELSRMERMGLITEASSTLYIEDLRLLQELCHEELAHAG